MRSSLVAFVVLVCLLVASLAGTVAGAADDPQELAAMRKTVKKLIADKKVQRVEIRQAKERVSTQFFVLPGKQLTQQEKNALRVVEDADTVQEDEEEAPRVRPVANHTLRMEKQVTITVVFGGKTEEMKGMIGERIPDPDGDWVVLQTKSGKELIRARDIRRISMAGGGVVPAGGEASSPK